MGSYCFPGAFQLSVSVQRSDPDILSFSYILLIIYILLISSVFIILAYTLPGMLRGGLVLYSSLNHPYSPFLCLFSGNDVFLQVFGSLPCFLARLSVHCIHSTITYSPSHFSISAVLPSNTPQRLFIHLTLYCIM